MVQSAAIDMLIHLINHPPEEAVEQAAWDAMWDRASRLWATEHEEPIRRAVKALRDVLFEHDRAVGLLALHIVLNKTYQSSGNFAWLHDFNGALQRIADDLVSVTVGPRRPAP